jgi:hypothetical protein
MCPVRTAIESGKAVVIANTGTDPHVRGLTRMPLPGTLSLTPRSAQEPITVKFASDIAFFGSFRLHPDLARTAWFL